jgi:ABC-2 type transport system ATP-binding protein
MNDVLVINNLHKKINKNIIIDDLSFHIGKGEILGLLGPNGAGKTTVIKMLVGLINPTKGQIKICGHDIKGDRDAALAKVGAIVENPELYPFMSGYANLKHFANMHNEKISKKSITDIIETLDMGSYIENKVKTYSLGMRQRLGLAQALLHKPELLILDEPTNGLDPQGIKEFRKHVQYLSSTLGISILISSHMLTEIELICDRIAIIEKGKLLKIQNINDLAKKVTSYHIKVDKINEAIQALKQNGFPVVSISKQLLKLEANEEEIPTVLSILAEISVKTYGVIPVSESLEEQYFETISDVGGNQ